VKEKVEKKLGLKRDRRKQEVVGIEHENLQKIFLGLKKPSRTYHLRTKRG